MSSNKLGLFSIVLLGINAIVGTGIFLLPNQAYAEVGVTSIAVIVFDAFLVISIALCFAEMGGMYKNNGGPYLYAKDAFGDFVGFEVGIMKWAISIIAWAAMAMGFPTALGAVWEPAQNPVVQKIIAITILVLLGIMNIMIVTVTERRKEIGIRKALGATPSDIRNQFLVESATLTLTGGAIGIGVGIIISAAILYARKLPFAIQWEACLIAFGFSVFVGIFFGLNPALRAAKLDPVEALASD